MTFLFRGPVARLSHAHVGLRDHLQYSRAAGHRHTSAALCHLWQQCPACTAATHTACKSAGIKGPIEVYNFPGSILETAGVDRPVPPFATVGSKDLRAGETFWPVRRYKWGTCEACNYEHSDFQLLKCAP